MIRIIMSPTGALIMIGIIIVLIILEFLIELYW
jgi:hypothetical protein